MPIGALVFYSYLGDLLLYYAKRVFSKKFSRNTEKLVTTGQTITTIILVLSMLCAIEVSGSGGFGSGSALVLRPGRNVPDSIGDSALFSLLDVCKDSEHVAIRRRGACTKWLLTQGLYCAQGSHEQLLQNIIHFEDIRVESIEELMGMSQGLLYRVRNWVCNLHRMNAGFRAPSTADANVDGVHCANRLQYFLFELESLLDDVSSKEPVGVLDAPNAPLRVFLDCCERYACGFIGDRATMVKRQLENFLCSRQQDYLSSDQYRLFFRLLYKKDLRVESKEALRCLTDVPLRRARDLTQVLHEANGKKLQQLENDMHCSYAVMQFQQITIQLCMLLDELCEQNLGVEGGGLVFLPEEAYTLSELNRAWRVVSDTYEGADDEEYYEGVGGLASKDQFWARHAPYYFEHCKRPSRYLSDS